LKISNGSCGKSFKGGATLPSARPSFIEGLTDEQVEALFQEARDADYAQITEEARAMLNAAPVNPTATTEGDIADLETGFSRLRKRYSSVMALDFFKAPGRGAAEALLGQIENRLCK